jgi:hypothetical protein
MPERPDYGQENLLLAGRSLAIAAVVCLLGAVLAYLTGDEVSARYGSFRTHMDAVLVLVTLGVAFLAAAGLAVSQLHSRRRTPRPMRSHYE